MNQINKTKKFLKNISFFFPHFFYMLKFTYNDDVIYDKKYLYLTKNIILLSITIEKDKIIRIIS